MAGWAALAAMAVAQVVSSRAGHLEIFVTLIVVALAVASVSFTTWGRSAADYRELLLDKLSAAGVGVRGRVLFTETLTPADLERRYDGWLGSIYGTSHNGRLAPFRRPGNRGPVAGLYLVGGSVHPGGGLPLVVIGSRIVADLVTEDLATGRI